MNVHSDIHWRERLAARYLDALDTGDLDAVITLCDEVAGDADAERFLRELMVGVDEEEAREASVAELSSDVVTLARQTMPSAFAQKEDVPAFTVALVARRLESEAGYQRLTPSDRALHTRLVDDATAMPEALGWPQFQRWCSGPLNTSSTTYRKLFHKTALMVAMSRNQQEGRLAAARRRTPPRPAPEDKS